VRGMRDFLPEEAKLVRYIEGKARRVAELYGYKEVITPVVEPYELLAAKAGEEVRLRMFLFKDLGGRDVALRPEFTPSVARIVAGVFRNEPRPFRLFSVGTVYRYDEPQRGRYREIRQSNFELMGSALPEADAEMLMLTASLMKSTGLKNFVFKVGHVGVLRGIFHQEKLAEKVQNAVMQLMDKKQYDDAVRTVEEAGVSKEAIRVLRKLVELKGSKVFDVVERMKQCVTGYEKATEATDNLFDILKLFSESEGEISMMVDAGFARGLEYYTGVIFEVNAPELDVALSGGGRYDKLIDLFGGEPTPAVGVAHGLDRILLAMQMQKVQPRVRKGKTVVVIPVQEELRAEAFKIAAELRDAGIRVEVEVMGRRMVKALEDANRRKTDYALIVGEKELEQRAVVVRDLWKREQKTVKMDSIVEVIKGAGAS
jgi:histidyl-tRNA synthetase